MKISAAKREYFVEIEVRKFTPKTIRSYRNNLNLFLRFCEEEAGITEVEDLSLSVVRQFSIYMSSKGRKGSYINGLLKVAKAFIQYCYDEGYGGFNTKKNFKWCKQDKAVVMAFQPSDVRRMMQSCKGCDFLQIRDVAVLTTLFETGIRCWELCCIQKQDIHVIFTRGGEHSTGRATNDADGIYRTEGNRYPGRSKRAGNASRSQENKRAGGIAPPAPVIVCRLVSLLRQGYAHQISASLPPSVSVCSE